MATDTNVFGLDRRWVAWVVFVGLFVSLPAFLFTNFEKLVKGKTFPEWLSENGWRWRVVLAALIWLAFSGVVSGGLYLLLGLISRRNRVPTKPKFTFRIDEKRSLAYLSREAGGFTLIQVAVVMQFIKHGSNSATMEDIEPSFQEMLNNTSDCQEISTFIFGEPIFQLLSTSENQDFRGRRFDPGVSPWFRFGAWLEIIGGDLKPSDLNIKHSLRLTMTALNQAPLTASLYFDWLKAAEKPTSCFPVWPRSLAAPRRDHIMTYDKGDELKKLSEGFVLAAPASDKSD